MYLTIQGQGQGQCQCQVQGRGEGQVSASVNMLLRIGSQTSQAVGVVIHKFAVIGGRPRVAAGSEAAAALGGGRGRI